jgi:hypothetical protein
MNIYIFLIINFIIGFLSDIILNHLSHFNFMKLNTLRPYFENKTMFEAALYAGITVFIIILAIIGIYYIIYKRYLPNTLNEYIIFLLISFVVGYIGDYIIYWIDIFPGLKLYYNQVGIGLWGAIAILFSVIISLFILFGLNKLKFI